MANAAKVKYMRFFQKCKISIIFIILNACSNANLGMGLLKHIIKINSASSSPHFLMSVRKGCLVLPEDGIAVMS